MTTEASIQKNQFQERIQRIQAAHAPAEAPKPQRVARPTKARTPRPAQAKPLDQPPRRLSKAGILGFAIGLAVMLCANVAAFRTSLITGSFFAEFLAAIGPLPIAGLMLFVIMVGFGLRDKPHVIGIALGLPLMYFGEPYLAFMAPDAWVQMYSADHVDAMLIQAGLREPMIVSQ